MLDEAELQLLKAEDDTATIILGGQVIGIEQGLFKGEQFWSLSTAEDDEIYGTGKDDKLFGNGGNNYISGGAGNDQLGGSSDNDTLDGDAGNDTLFGFAADILRGGADNDTYIMVLYDGASGGKIQIEDVEGVADSLKLSSYDEDSSYQLENEVKLSKTLVEGSIGVQQDGTSLMVDINKDGVVNRANYVEIINFYKKNIDEKGLVFYTPGSGYIEKINFSDEPNLSGEPNLSVVINESSDPVTIGENLTYTLTVTNNGSGNATEVVEPSFD